MEHEQKCIKGQLVAKLQDGLYMKYVFEDLHFTNPYYRFMTLTRCPNWNGQEIIPMQEGFVTFKSVIAGKDTYFDNKDMEFKQYNYTAIYFLDFVPITHVLNNGFVVEKGALKVS